MKNSERKGTFPVVSLKRELQEAENSLPGGCGRRRSYLLDLFTEFAHDLRDVNVGGHLGLLLLLPLLQDDGAQAGLPVLGVVLQLSITGRQKPNIFDCPRWLLHC